MPPILTNSPKIHYQLQTSFNNYITTDTKEIGDNLIVPESSLIDELQDRIRILEERLNLFAKFFGIQFF